MKFTLIALLPAILAHVALFFLGKGKIDQDYWFFLILGLLFLGGLLAAVFIAHSIRKRNVERSPVLITGIATITFILYVVTFLFSGCLIAVTAGL